MDAVPVTATLKPTKRVLMQRVHGRATEGARRREANQNGAARYRRAMIQTAWMMPGM